MYKNTAVISLLSFLVSQGVFSAPNIDESLVYTRPDVAKPVALAKQEPGFSSKDPEALGSNEFLDVPKAAEDAFEVVAQEPTEPEKLNEAVDLDALEVPEGKLESTKSDRLNKGFTRPAEAQNSDESSVEPESSEAESQAEGAGNVVNKEDVNVKNYDDEDVPNRKTDVASAPIEELEPKDVSEGSDEEGASPDVVSDPEESSENKDSLLDLSYKRPESKKNDKKNPENSTAGAAEGAGSSKSGDSKAEPITTSSSESVPRYTKESKLEDSSEFSPKPESTGETTSESNPESVTGSSSENKPGEAGKSESSYKRPEKDFSGEGSVDADNSSSASVSFASVSSDSAQSASESSASTSPSSSFDASKETNEPESSYKRPENNDNKKDGKDNSKKDKSYLDSFKEWYKKTFQ